MKQETWAKIEEYLREAVCHLSGDLGEFEEYLAHNELGLAWEVLLKIADSQGLVTAEFWRPMAKAAGLMVENSYFTPNLD